MLCSHVCFHARCRIDGQLFEVKRETIEGSEVLLQLAEFFKPGTPIQLDRSPELFKQVLHWLRTSHLPGSVVGDVNMRADLEREAKFYHLPRLESRCHVGYSIGLLPDCVQEAISSKRSRIANICAGQTIDAFAGLEQVFYSPSPSLRRDWLLCDDVNLIGVELCEANRNWGYKKTLSIVHNFEEFKNNLSDLHGGLLDDLPADLQKHLVIAGGGTTMSLLGSPLMAKDVDLFLVNFPNDANEYKAELHATSVRSFF